MYALRATARLLGRLGPPSPEPHPPTSTTLGDWYATMLPWRSPLALFVNEPTLLPVLLPLAPAKTLLDRFPDTLAEVLAALGSPPAFIAAETAHMREHYTTKTASRSVVGSMNEFAFFANVARAHGQADDLLGLAVDLAHTPCGPLRKSKDFPDLELADRIAKAGW